MEGKRQRLRRETAVETEKKKLPEIAEAELWVAKCGVYIGFCNLLEEHRRE